MTLDLALVTWQPEGIARVAAQQLPRVDGVRYIVSWQCHGNAPVPESLASRDDVEIHRCELTGVSNNRNNAVDHCRADIILMADDDITYNPDSLRAIIKAFEAHPEVDVALLQFSGSTPKPYPAKETPLRLPLPRGMWVSLVEIAVRRKSGARALRFCTELGPGSRFTCAEDEVFFLSAIRRGLTCRHFPINIGTHPTISSGATAIRSRAYCEAIGIVLALNYKWQAPIRAILRSWRLSRHKRAPFFWALYGILSGIAKTPGFKRRNKKYLW